MTKDEMLERAKAFMVRTYGAPLEMDAASRDRFYERLGLLVTFVSEIAPSDEPTRTDLYPVNPEPGPFNRAGVEPEAPPMEREGLTTAMLREGAHLLEGGKLLARLYAACNEIDALRSALNRREDVDKTGL